MSPEHPVPRYPVSLFSFSGMMLPRRVTPFFILDFSLTGRIRFFLSLRNQFPQLLLLARGKTKSTVITKIVG
jgi:hypothetical protein